MITLSPILKLRCKLQLSVRSVFKMLLQFVAMYIFVGTGCMGDNLTKFSPKVSDTSTTALYDGITVEGNVMHGQYVYYKFTISYDSNEQRLYNSNIDETKSNLRAAANSSSDGQSSLRMSSHIAESNINTGSDPYDPSDPLKNSIIMDLKPIVGDSDIFVACSLAATGDNAGTPSKLPGHFNFSSEHYSEDMISVSAMDPLNCARAGRSGVFYISIYGFSQIHSYYSFTVTKYGGVRTVIAGLPERGRVLSGLGAWYRFQLPDANAQEVTIIVTPILSDVDLYVKLGKTNPAHISNGILNSNDSSRYIGDGAYVPASRTSYDYKSGGIGTETETIILSERILAACAASHCWVSILVDSFSTAEYSLLVTLRDSTVQLIDSIPLYSSVAKGGFQYYQLPVSSNGTVTAVVTIITGYPWLYISAVDHWPNSTSSQGVISDHGMSSYSTPYVTLPLGKIYREGMMVYLAVGNCPDDAEFTIRASVRPQVVDGGEAEVVLYGLLNGIPQDDVMPNPTIPQHNSHSHWIFYIFLVPVGHGTLLVRFRPLYGQQYVYATRCNSTHASQCAVSSLPNFTNYIATTEGSYTGDVEIMRNDGKECSYILGVYSSEATVYQLSVTLANTILVLAPGVPIYDTVSQGDDSYFSFALTGDKLTLMIGLETLTGYVDLYVSTNHTHPNFVNSTWQSASFSFDKLIISPTDPFYCSPCTYYISARGFRETSYIITASVRTDMKVLSDGVPFTDSVEFLESNRYAYEYTLRNDSDIRIDLHFLSFTSSVTVQVMVNDNDIFYSVVSSDRTIDISHTDIAFTPCLALAGCMIHITLFGSGATTDYELTLSTSHSVTLLRWGRTVKGIVQPGKYIGYRILITEPETSVSAAAAPARSDIKTPLALDISTTVLSDVFRLTMIQFTGQVTASVSCSKGPSSGMPNITNHLWILRPSYSTFLDIPILFAAAAGCFKASPSSGTAGSGQLLITVHGDTASSFSVAMSLLSNSSSLSSATLLTPGLPSVDSVADKEFRYYTVRPGIASEDIRVIATILRGDVDLYISNTWASRPVLAPGHSSDLPVVTSFNYSSTGVGTAGEEILVPKSAIARMCANRGPYCYLLVGVYGSHGEERMSDSESIQPDNRDGMVYIERAGAGVDVADSSYSIVVTSKDSIIALVNGVPVKGRVVLGAAQYYMYRMITAKKDLVISVTPLYGDPDLYVSFSPVTHPTRSNYTYVAASDGADTLTLQASMLSLHCFLDPATNKACDIYIGVLAWRNSSYTLVASVNDGFESRISLLDGQPQTGAVGVGKYVYYEYQVGSASNTGRNPLRFSLFSLNGMDLDLYLTFKNQSSTGKSSDNDIPGMSRNDYSSTNIDGASDEILVSPGDPHFCTECTVYLAVYAFSGLLVEGEYVLVASFGGVEELPQGRVASGVVKKGFYRYYYFHNEDSLAHISIGLTMQTGDADLCISTYNPDASSQFLAPLSSLLSSSSPVSRNDIGRVAMVLPTMQSSMWRSMHFGDDLVKINYDDKNFCYNCDYIIGVFGFKNSTYTLLASTADDVVTKLVPNSALEVASEVGGVKLFSVGTLNSADDVLFTVTPLDSGDEDLYLQVYQNDSVLSTGHLLLNISDPRTYKYTTKGTQYDFILVKGPHAQGTTFVVAVHATDSIMPFTDVKLSAAATSGVPQSIDTLKQLSAMSLLSSPVPQTRYTILASYSQQHVLLMSGVPQNHYVSKGDTEFFRFIPEEDTDMRITVTARSGDPDLFVSSDFEYPRCDRGGSSQIFNCNNYTWSSRLYSSDQIIISRDFPCEAVLSSTVVSKTCNSSRSYQPRKHKAVNIGVYGYYMNTAFTLLASHVGGHSQLTAGVGMMSTASQTFECSERDADSGICLPSSAVKRQVLAAYFSFVVIPSKMLYGASKDATDSSTSGDALVITVIPSCNSTASFSTAASSLSSSSKLDKGCPAGCDCSPLRVYITSCVQGLCTSNDRRPSGLAGQSGASFLVSQAGSSIILSSTNPSSHIVANTRTDSAVGGAAANTDLSASAAGYCNPSTAGGSCVYYIAVVSETLPLSSIPPVFQISAQTPSSVTLLPCEAKTQASPDGLRIVGTESIALSPAPSRRYYEVCPSNGDSGKDSSSVFNMSLVVTLEQCSGHTDIFACDTALDADSSSSSSRGGAHCLGSLPTSLDWAYKSNETQTCTRHWIENANMKSGGWSREICTSQVQGQRRPILTLPYRINKDGVSLGGNYYLMVVGAGDYTLTMESGVLGMGATKKSPRLVQITVDGNSGGRVSILSKTKSSYPATVTGPLILSWSPSLLLFPSSSLAVAPRLLQYYAHVVLLDQIQGDSESAARLDTQCGLKKALETYPAGTVKVISLPNPSALSATPDNVVTLELGAQTAMQHIFADNDIPINRKLSITIVAVCNGLCLRRATIESHGAGLCNSSSVDCKPQFFEYTPLVIMSVYSPSSSTRTWFGFLLSMTSWVVLIAILFMVAVGAKIVYERQIAVGSSNVRDDSSSPSTPYVGNWGDSPDGSRGWFSNWGYSKLGFTEMVDTTSFSQVPSSQTLDVGDSTNSNSLGRNGNRGAGKMPIWLHSISERATPFVDRLVAGTRTTGHIISDTASAAFSYMNFSSLNRTSSEGGSEFDKSTYPLNNGSSSGSGNHEQSSSYRPPSPLPFTTQSPSFSISSSIPVSVPTSIAMTDRINRERDPGSGPAYTSLRSQRQFDSRTSDRGGAMLDITAQDEDEEEDEEEEKR